MNRIDALVVKAVTVVAVVVAALAPLGAAAGAAAAQPQHAITTQAGSDGTTDDTNPWS
ncbi:hypothetical protein ACH47C_16735 [Streptomyces rishiriensis]|uniref:hypothetical protein n=1 Tax=Streptomyces rishiriensis TaxID=68264 RepID=UPI00131F181E|nr:hypothetical protein [Streptomyces rishiriensis]